MISLGLISLALSVAQVPEVDMQLNGSDLEIMHAKSIQVKCDWNAGHKELGGTGNLFLQVEECNPLGLR